MPLRLNSTGGINNIESGSTETFNSLNDLRFTGYSNGNVLMTLSSSGNLGVGTTSPGTKLHIDGTETILRISGAVGNQQGINFSDTTTRWSIYKPENTTDLRWWDGTTDRVTFKNGGNIGIGTTSPISTLDVFGNLSLTGSTTLVNAKDVGSLYNQPGRVHWWFEPSITSGNLDFVLGPPVIEGINASCIGIANNTNRDLSVDIRFIGDVENYTIGNLTGTFYVANNSGQMVNTIYQYEVPAALTDMWSDPNFQPTKLSIDSGYIRTTIPAGGSIQSTDSYNDEFFKLILRRLNVEILRGGSFTIPRGFIGIGTTSPSKSLDVVGGVRITSGGLVATFNSNTLGSLFTTGGNTGIATTRPNFTLDVNGTLEVANTNGTFLFNSGGNLGIGTTSPSTTLELRNSNGNSNLPIITLNGGGGAGNFVGISFSPWNGRSGGAASRILGVDDGNSSAHLSFLTAPSGNGTTSIERMRITSSGDVGIGTTSPGTKLHINGTETILRISGAVGNQQGINFFDTASRWSIYKPQNTTDLRWWDGTADRVTFKNGGNIGIGTSSPNALLDVNGKVEIHDATIGTPSNGTVGGNGTRLVLWPGDASNTPYALGINGATLWYGAPTGASHVWFNSTTESMRLSSSGNFGIGTSSPGSKLTVSPGNGSSNVSLLDFRNTDGFGIYVESIGISARGNTFRMLARDFNNFATITTRDVLTLRPEGTVGIGTSSPLSSLDVGGFIVTRARANQSTFDTILNAITETDAAIVGTPLEDILCCYHKSFGVKYRIFLTGSTYFTGQHGNKPVDSNLKTNISDHVGLIVSSADEGYYSINPITKQEITGKDAIQISEALPKIKLTTVDQDPAVWGVITNVKNENYNTDGTFDKDDTTEWGDRLGNRIRINGVGEGGIWVSNINGNIKNGDFICSSNIPGYGRIQNDDLLHNYTVAKATCSVNFNDPNLNEKFNIRYLSVDGNIITKEEFDSANGQNVYIAAFIGCSYHCS